MMPRANGQVRHLAWIDGASFVAEDRGADVRWWRYDVGSEERTPLWGVSTVRASDSDRIVSLNSLAMLTVSADGSEVAGILSGDDQWELWRVSIDVGHLRPDVRDLLLELREEGWISAKRAISYLNGHFGFLEEQGRPKPAP